MAVINENEILFGAVGQIEKLSAPADAAVMLLDGGDPSMCVMGIAELEEDET